MFKRVAGLAPKVLGRRPISSHDFAKNITDLMALPQDRHRGDSDFITLCASIPGIKVPKFIGPILGTSYDVDDYSHGYRYRNMEGSPALQDATMQHYQGEGFDLAGCKPIFTQSIHQVLELVTNRVMDSSKDKVLMTTPTFGLFFDSLYNRGFEIDLTELSRKDDFKLTPEVLTDMLGRNPDAKLLIFINPDNPTGKSYSKEELEALAKILVHHNQQRRVEGKDAMLVFNDEASNSIGPINRDISHPSLGACPGVNDFTITTRSLSKTLAPSIGVCFAMAPSDVVSTIFNQGTLGKDFGPNWPAQHLTTQLLTTHKKEFGEHISKSNEFYLKNMRKVTSVIDSINVKMDRRFGSKLDGQFCSLLTNPEGGLQCVLEMPALLGCQIPGEDDVIDGSLSFSEHLIKTKKVSVLPASAFGLDEKVVMARLTICKNPPERLEAGLLRMQDCLLDFDLDKRREPLSGSLKSRDDFELNQSKSLPNSQANPELRTT